MNKLTEKPMEFNGTTKPKLFNVDMLAKSSLSAKRETFRKKPCPKLHAFNLTEVC